MGAIGPSPLKVPRWPLLPWTSDPLQCEAITQYTTLLFGTVKPNLPTRTQQAQIDTQYSCGLRLKAISVTQNPDLPYKFNQFGSTLVGLGNSSNYLHHETALPRALAWTPHIHRISNDLASISGLPKWCGAPSSSKMTVSPYFSKCRQTQETWKIKERIIILL